MRSYRQYCGLARALDVVGKRWTLLIVRELLIRGTARYSDLQQGLPGIPTNLLGDRLRQLQRAGLVERAQPIQGFTLTARGQAVDSLLLTLRHCAAPLLDVLR